MRIHNRFPSKVRSGSPAAPGLTAARHNEIPIRSKVSQPVFSMRIGLFDFSLNEFVRIISLQCFLAVTVVPEINRPVRVLVITCYCRHIAARNRPTVAIVYMTR